MPSEPGDLTFYRPAKGDDTGTLVALMTGGPYCHVGITTADGSIVSAQTNGVISQRLGTPDGVRHTGAHCPHVADALVWLAQQIGKPYSYAAVADATMFRIWHLFQPQFAWGPIHVAVPYPNFTAVVGTHRFDCSSLAARFLIRAGCNILPAEVIANPDVSTPNSLMLDMA